MCVLGLGFDCRLSWLYMIVPCGGSLEVSSSFFHVPYGSKLEPRQISDAVLLLEHSQSFCRFQEAWKASRWLLSQGLHDIPWWRFHLHKSDALKHSTSASPFYFPHQSIPPSFPGNGAQSLDLPRWRIRALWRQWQKLSQHRRHRRQTRDLLGRVVLGGLRHVLWAWWKVLMQKAGAVFLRVCGGSLDQCSFQAFKLDPSRPYSFC